MTRTPPADVTVTLRCSNRCVFCPRSTLAHVRVRGGADLDARLRAIRAGSRRVILTGGEVTELDDPPALVARCRALGFDEVAIISNGRRLRDPALAAALVRAGLTEACITVYDLRPEVHDRLTRVPGSLTQTLAGLDRMLAAAGAAAPATALAVRANTVLCGANADGLQTLAGALAARSVRGLLIADAVLSDAFDEPCEHGRVIALARALAADPRLRALDVVWRGFPTCLLHGVPGVRAEPQQIDTTPGEDDALEAYFAEFHGHFEHAAACAGCAVRDRCPGLQRRYAARYGAGSLRPLASAPGEGCATGSAAGDLVGFEPELDPGRLAITPTDACQLRCGYCRVVLGARRAPPAVLDRAVDLLLTSARTELELQFFGGEPLLCGDEVRRTMARAERRARERGKRLRFTVTTNGLLLDEGWLEVLRAHDTRVLFSADGDPQTMAAFRPLRRPAAEELAPYRTIEDHLRGLIASGIPYFVNLVLTPAAAGELPRRVAYLADLGADTIQLCYATGPGWTAAARDAFCRGLETAVGLARARTAAGHPLRLQNLGSRAEPTILSTDLLVDVDGTLYGDAALFAERSLPGLRDAYRIGSVFELTAFDGLRRRRAHNLALLRATYPEGSEVRRAVEQQLALGRQVQATLDRLGGSAPMPGAERGSGRPARPARRDRNPLLRTVLQASLPEQVALMGRRPALLKLPLLMLSNPCTWDCIFCRSKNIDATPLAAAEGWLDDNREEGQRRLGLVGNEPLAHPDIDRILAAARERGFERFDALTTAEPLADAGRARALVDAGVRGYGMPLFGPSAAIHDAITRVPGSFDTTLRALENLAGLGADVHVHANLLLQNMDHVGALERLVVDDLGLPLCLIPVRPKDAHLPYRALAPGYDTIVERAHVRCLVAFPLCVARRVQRPAVPDGRIVSDLLKVYVLDQPFIKPPACDGCADRARCAGTFQAHVDLYGDGELRPRPNGS